MSDARTTAYADAIVSVARAENALPEVEDELARFGRIVQSNEELRSTLSDSRLPVERRAQIVTDVLEGRASSTTVAVVSMLVAAGRGGDLPAIAEEVVRRTAEASGLSVAEVRSAVALTDDQISRLADALSARTQQKITVRNVVDPSVVGGVVTRIGDSVIDGSVRTRLNRLRDAF